jgi:ADP-ribose pyrophosphatase
MPDETHLPRPPRIALAIARDRTPSSQASHGSEPFVDVRHLDLVARYPDGTQSEPFAYDVVTRKALDAVIIAAFERRGGERHVYMRSATRAPLALREPEGADLWEVPAGMIEPGESPRETAVRELEEELGFRVPASALVDLGPWTIPLPGMIAERQHFFQVDVTHAERGTPRGDGSPLERGAQVVAVPLPSLLALCRAGQLRDAKSELALRRLAEVG